MKLAEKLGEVKKETKPKSSIYFVSSKYLGEKNMPAENQEFDEVEKMRKDAIKERYRQIREKEADLYLKKREKELEREMVEGTPSEGGVQNISVQDAAQIAQLPPEKQQAVIMVMQAFKSQGGRQDTASALLPLLMMNQMNPPQNQMTPESLLRLMIEFQKATQGMQPQDKTDVVSKMTDKILDMYKTEVTELKTSAQSPLETIKAIGEAAKTMGYKSPGEGGEGNTQVEMARIEMQERQNMREWEFKMDEGKTARTLGTIEQIMRGLNPRQIISDVVEGVVSKAMAPPPQQPQAAQQHASTQQVLQYKCMCGATFAAPADQTSAVCVACGREYPDLAVAAAKANAEQSAQSQQKQKEEKKNGDGSDEGSSDEGANIRI